MPSRQTDIISFSDFFVIDKHDEVSIYSKNNTIIRLCHFVTKSCYLLCFYLNSEACLVFIFYLCHLRLDSLTVNPTQLILLREPSFIIISLFLFLNTSCAYVENTVVRFRNLIRHQHNK